MALIFGYVILLFSLQVFAHYNETKYPKYPRVNGFSWSNCGSGNDPIKINSLLVAPDPIRIPGNLSIAIDVTLSQNITSPSAFKLHIQKKVAFIWVTIPCEKGMGSCNYDDFCQQWPIQKKCPEAFKKYKIPCQCPIPANNYKLPLTPVMNMGEEPIPKWMENGEYKAQITINNPKGHRMICTEVQFQLEADLQKP